MGVERPAIGRVIGGKYRIERPLGAGAWAQVFLAEHVELHSKVAIKLLSNWESSTEKQLGRFLREARAAARLKTVHVCKVLDVGRTEEGAPYTVLEHLDGTDFQHVVEERGRLDPAVAVEYVLQACEGLAEAHAGGIVHRDLKPANMFLTAAPDGSPLVKILDFGISKEMTGQKIDVHLTRSTDLLGTPFYMSPEQLRDAADVDARTDIWSMGVILWRMLSGVMPFEGASFAELCVSIMTGPPPSRGVEHIPFGLQAALLRCLEKDPARRYQNVRQLAAALSQWLSGDESSRVGRISRVLSRMGSGAEATAGGPNATPVPARAPTPVPVAVAAVGAFDPTEDASGATPRPFAIPTPSARHQVPGPLGVATDDRTNFYVAPARAPGWRRPVIIGAVLAGIVMAGAAVVVLASNGESPVATAAADAGVASAPAPRPAADPPPPAADEVAAPASAPESDVAPGVDPPEPAADPAADPASTPTAAPPPRRPPVRRGAKRKPPARPPPPAPTDLYDRRR